MNRFCSKILKRNFSNLSNQPKVTILQGKLQGTIGNDINGDRFFKFQGIPYAEPPVGNLRFKASKPLKQWSGILDATKEGSNCCRHIIFKNKISGSENCLFLNVFTKNVNSNYLKPVMFLIYNGGFVTGSSSTELFGPEYLISQDVVIVSLNFRLGILDPDLDVPGNTGFKDILLVLKWVQQNICEFGGDPRNVTIFGQSSGAVATHLFVLYQTNKNLFHKAICQSGCALMPGFSGVKGTEKISHFFEPGSNEKQIYKRLIQMPVEELYKIQNEIDIMQDFVGSLQRPFGYVVENLKEKAFITEKPEVVLSRNEVQSVPLMMGFTTAEWLRFTLFSKKMHPGFETCEDLIPCDFGLEIGSKESQYIAKELRKFYFGSDEINVARNRRLQIENDLGILYHIYRSVKQHLFTPKHPVYLYRVTIESQLNLIKQALKITHPGVAHADELGYLFKTNFLPNFQPKSKEEKAVKRFVKLWTNFAKFGNPTPTSNDSDLDVFGILLLKIKIIF